MKTDYPKWLHSAEKLLSAAGNSFGGGFPKPRRDSAIQIGRVLQALVEVIFRDPSSLFGLGGTTSRTTGNFFLPWGSRFLPYEKPLFRP